MLLPLLINLMDTSGGVPGTTGGNVLGLLFPLNLESPPNQNILVRAVADGTYNGLFHPKGDVFYLQNITDYSDSTISIVPPGNPDYPVYGWMTIVAIQPTFEQYRSLESWPHDYIKRLTL